MSNRFFRIAALTAATCVLQLPVFAQDGQGNISQPPGPAIAVRSNTIHQEVDFDARPEQLYEALLDSKKFSAFTAQSTGFSAQSATIDRSVGGAFSLFDGHIVGRNLELVQNQRIVQAWRVVDWPAGVYSIVKFELKPRGSGTHLVFDHTGFPDSLHDPLAAGWQSHYWDLLSKYFRSTSTAAKSR
jgi:activator of HSP90 ATPase